MIRENTPDFGYTENKAEKDFNIGNMNSTERDIDVDSIYQQELRKADINKYNNFQKKIEESHFDLIQDTSQGAIQGIDVDDKLSLYGSGVDVGNIYSTLSDGTPISRYNEGYFVGEDNEDIYAKQQSTSDKWLKGVGKFALKTGLNTIGGTAGMAWGAIQAIGQGNYEKVYDNSFFDYIDDQGKKLDNFQANYRAQEERDLGFFDSTTTANFWADDVLGGLSFMAGTILSEGAWAAATGGTSLATTASRMALRGTKNFGKLSKVITKGVKDGSKSYNKYASKALRDSMVKNVNRSGTLGKLGDLARFTYTGAGFEAGMEARLYQREQKDSFYKDFKELNNREPNSEEIAEFEKNLDLTTNTLFVANLGLVGASNFTILGKPLGISSPFKYSNKYLNKVVFGKGVTSTLDEAGKRVTKAITKTNIQKGLGFSKGLLKNPIMEGVVEEGGQATFSSAMEEYLTSRYNPKKEVIDMIEGLYNGAAHTYGTKEGWKEVGLGMLIGLIGGEGTSIVSGNKLFQEAREGLSNQDGYTRYYEVDTNAPNNKGREITEEEAKGREDILKESKGSVGLASSMNDNSSEKVVNRMLSMNKAFGQKLEEQIGLANQLNDIELARDIAEKEGDLVKIGDSNHKIMMTSAQKAVEGDYLDQQVNDFRLSLELKSVAEEGNTSELADTYGIPQSEVSSKIDELVNDYVSIADKIEKHSQFADYLIPDNPSELSEGLSFSDIQLIKSAIVYQMGMSDFYEKNSRNTIDAITAELSTSNKELGTRANIVLKEYDKLKKIPKDLVERKNKVEQALKATKNRLQQINSIEAQKDESERNRAFKSIAPLENKIRELTKELAKVNRLVSEKTKALEGMSSNIDSKLQVLATELDSIDPLASSEGFVEASTVEKTIEDLKDLEEAIENQGNPQVALRVKFLAQQYHKALGMWERNAKTLADISDPKLGLSNIKTIVSRKKKAGITTLDFLKRLKETANEELLFSKDIGKINSIIESDDKTNQEKFNEDPGADILNEEIIDKGKPLTVQDKIKDLKAKLKELLVSETPYMVNKSDNIDAVLEDKKPTEEEVQEYMDIRKSFKSGDINKLIKRDPFKPNLEGGISSRVKERSGLTDEQIKKYQELSQKMLNWRVLTGANSEGTSVHDIIENIEKYQEQKNFSNNKKTTEQIVEFIKAGEETFSVGRRDTDMVQTMSYVNIAKSGDFYSIAHLGLDELLDINNYGIAEVNRVSQNISEDSIPTIEETITIEKGGKTIEITVSEVSGNQIKIKSKDIDTLLDMMEMRRLKQNNKTAWGYLFDKNGKLVKTSWDIMPIQGPKLERQSIYNLKPNDKLNFVLDVKDKYNLDNIYPILTEYLQAEVLGNKEMASSKLKEATAKVAIYIQTENGEFVALQKMGLPGGNASKIREKAIETMLGEMKGTLGIEDLINPTNTSQFKLPFQTTVNKIFVNIPNITLDSEGNVNTHKISKEASDNYIVDYGYSTKGKLSSKDTAIRMGAIPKDTDTPYVVLLQGKTKIAVPVALNISTSSIKKQVSSILNEDISNIKKESKILDIVSSDITGVIDLSTEEGIIELFNNIENSPLAYSKEDILKMTKEEFIDKSEIIIDLNGSEPFFVSPKIKTNLSTQELIDTDTQMVYKEPPISAEDKWNMITRNEQKLALAETDSQVDKIVSEINDNIFKRLYDTVLSFKEQVRNFAKNTKAVPIVYTDQSAKEFLMSIIDLRDNGIPKDILDTYQDKIKKVLENPTEESLNDLKDEFLQKVKSRYEAVAKESLDTNNLYRVPTNEKEQVLFEERGLVRVKGDFYKKVNNSYSVDQLLEGLYEKYKQGKMPVHMKIPEGLSFIDFSNKLPKNKLEIYKKYYNSRPKSKYSIGKRGSKSIADTFLKEDFPGEFEIFKNKVSKNSDLYKNVLSKLTVEGDGNIHQNLSLTKEIFNKYRKDLGDYYNLLLDYSLINKHMNLEDTNENVIFAEDVVLNNRLIALNQNENLLEVKDTQFSLNKDNSITIKRSEKPSFIKHGGKVYEKYTDLGEGNTVYHEIGTIDENFMNYEVKEPFGGQTRKNSSESTDTSIEIVKNKGQDQIKCK